MDFNIDFMQRSKEIDDKILELKNCINKNIDGLDEADIYNLMSDKFNKIMHICIADEFSSMRNYFSYSKNQIDEIVKNLNLSKVCMSGMQRNLLELKSIIEFIYSKYIFYLDYWRSECVYHGWSWAEDDGTMKNQAKVTEEITNKFKDIYALILSGIGEKCK